MRPSLRPTCQWFRRVLPPGWWVFLLLYLLMAATYYLSNGHGSASLLWPHRLVLLAFAGYYGYRRSVAAHPANQPAYRAWLRATPWKPGQPLPLWPVMPVWQDLAVAGAVLLLGLEGGPRFLLWLALVFLLVYNVGQLPGLVRLRAYKTAYGLLWGLGLIPALVPGASAVLRWLAVLTPAVLLGQYEAMMRFDWWADGPIRIRGERFAAQVFRQAARVAAERPLRPARCLAFAFLCGGAAAAITRMLVSLDWLPPLVPSTCAASAFCLAAILLAGSRLSIYCAEHRPPITLAGRLATGRLVIPGFDRVLVAPLALLALGLAFYADLALNGLTPFGAGLRAASLVLVALAMGPTLQGWKLTGHHRAVTGYQKPTLPELLNPDSQAAPEPVPLPARKLRQVNLTDLPLLPGVRSRHGRFMVWVALCVALGLAMIILAVSGGLPPYLKGLSFIGGMLLLGFPPIVYAIDRISEFHPAYRPDYLDWLKNTPWRPGMPLPLGPVHLTGLDGALLVFCVALCTGACLIFSEFVIKGVRWPAALPTLAEALPVAGWILFVLLVLHAVDLARVLLRTNQFTSLMVLLILVGGQVLAFPRLPVMIPLAIAMAALGHWGVHRAWRDYPWEGRLFDNLRGLNSNNFIHPRQNGFILEEADEQKVGRLNFLLSARVAPRLLSRSRRLALVLVSGWIYLAMALRFPSAKYDESFTLLTIIMGFCGLSGLALRLQLYLEPVRPPLSLAGRLLTMRWIIPGFDRVFVTPLVALAAGIVMPVMIYQFHAPFELLVFAWLTVWSLLLLDGPSLSNWRLTGHHRPGPPPREPQNWLERAIARRRGRSGVAQ